MNQIVQNDRRKLLGLALASLLTCQKKWVIYIFEFVDNNLSCFRPILELFKEIITVCVETLNDIMRKTDDGIYAEWVDYQFCNSLIVFVIVKHN